MNRTEIQWCDSTINPTSGCDGCELKRPGRDGSCYAWPIHERRLARTLPDKYAADFHEVRMIAGRMVQAARWSDLTGRRRPHKPWLDRLPRVIFVGDMADIFSQAVTFEYLRDEVFGAIRDGRGERHTWMILTKQPRRLAEFARWFVREGPWPPNLLCGTSVTTRATATRIDALREVPGPRFVSAEPLWEPIDPDLSGVDLVIAGGQSGRDARPCHLDWLRSLRDLCGRSGVPFFLKQLGSNAHGPDGRLRLRDGHGGDWGEWPDDLRVREWPAWWAREADRGRPVEPSGQASTRHAGPSAGRGAGRLPSRPCGGSPEPPGASSWRIGATSASS
jgi:protein gp37